jgi:hypothetical protein
MDAATPVSPDGEHTLAVIGNLTRLAGFMGIKQKPYSLILTDRRIVFAELTKEQLTALLNQAGDEAKAEGKGRMARWNAQRLARGGYHKRYWDMTPDAALAESPDNFAVERGAIKNVKFKTGIIDEQRNTPDLVTIKTTADKYKLRVDGMLPAVKEAFHTAGLT